MRMKALSLWQPWASLVALGLKTYETRSWPTRYRGPLAIHAAKRPIDQAGRDVLRVMRSDLHLERVYFGGIVCVCTLVECVNTEALTTDEWYPQRHMGDFSPGRFAWRIMDAFQLRSPLACRGHQGFFDVDIPDASVPSGFLRVLRALGGEA